MKKPVLAIRNLGKRIGGGVMGSLMLFSGTVMPYQGIIQPKPLTGFAVEAADSAAYIPYAEETKPVTTTVSQTVTTAASTTSVSKATAVGSTAAASATQTSATAKPSTTTKAAVTTKPAATTKGAATTKPAATTKVTATTKPAATTKQTAAADGFEFTVDQSAAVLEKYTGTASEITIPATYQGVPVTEISSDAFSQNKQLKSAELPASIRVIGSSAFSNCTALEKITLQEGLETIGSNAFSNTALTEIYIPASLQKADQPFYNCKELKKVTFGKGITKIPNDIFRYCYGLTEITIPETVTEIGNDAFEYCNQLKTAVLSEGLETIGSNAFSNTALTEIYIPASLQKAEQPFYNCKELNKVTFGKGMTKIPYALFRYCYGLTEITIPETVTEISNDAFEYCNQLKTAVLSEGLETIGTDAFDGAALTEIYIPTSLKKAEQPFYNCKELNKVTFGKGMTKIPYALFRYCYGLTEITIPETVTEIGNDAFEYCNQLKTVVLSEGLETIGTDAFDGTALTEIYIPASLRKADQPFTNCKELQKVTFGKGITKIPYALFRYCYGLTEITIPETVTEIGNDAFEYCNQLKTVVLSEGLETIGTDAFDGTALTEIYIPASIRKADQPFYGCKALKKVTFGKGITKIPYALFRYCYGLTEITIPETVTEIGNSAFAYCNHLKTAVLSEGLETIDTDAFEGTALTEIYIPASIRKANQPFYGCKELKKVTFGKGITTIPSDLFRYCQGLTEVTIPETVTEIGNGAFEYCNHLKTAVLPEGLETIGSNAFSYTGLTKICIPSSLKKAPQPFYGCKSLEYAEFSEGMVNVPEKIFEDASALKTVRLASTTQTIGKDAFYGCTMLSKIDPQDVKPVFYSSTFRRCSNLYDPRFHLLDRTASDLTVNTTLGAVSGLMHFTVRYKLDERAEKPKLHLSLPDRLTILPDSVTCTDTEITFENDLKTFALKEHEGTLRFSVRVQETGCAEVSAAAEFTFNQEYWEELIGTLNIDAPALTVNAPETVNGLSALVYGIAGKKQEVTVYVNDTAAKTVTADQYTGKYRVTVPLPQGEDSAVYEIRAKADDNETDAVKVTYRKSAPTVTSVLMYYKDDTDNPMDITAVFTEGKSPVFSYNPAYPLQFEIKMTNPETIGRLFITSKKGQDVRYMEAFYDAEKDSWLTKPGYFDTNNHSYVPGTLNISILEKPQEALVDVQNPEKYESIMHLPDSTPQEYKDNSTFTVLAQDENAFGAEVNFTDGKDDHKFLYYSENSDTVTLDGKTVTAEEVAKDPQKYGYFEVPAAAVNGDERYHYYCRYDDTGFLLDGFIIDTFDQYMAAYNGAYTGYSLLEILEGDEADSFAGRFLNNFVVTQTTNIFDDLTGGLYGEYGTYLALIGDTTDLFSRLYHANGNEMQQCAAVMLFAAQVIVDTGGLEFLLVTCGLASPVAMLVAVGATVLLSYLGDLLDDWIDGKGIFSSGGLLRFLIDPSGIVYEAVISNPVAGAEVRIYFLDPESGKQTEWNASDYEQDNPLKTNSDGAYAWDVPEGKWKVVCTKEGYDKAESDWLTVPPVQTDVNFALVSHAVPGIEDMKVTENVLTVTFTKYMTDATVTKDSVQLRQGDKQIACTVKPVKEQGNESGFSAVYQITPEEAVNWSSTSLVLTADAKSYADVAAAAAAYPVAGDLATGDVNGDGTVSVDDAQLVLIEYVNAMTGLESGFNEKQQRAGDVNGDSEISVEDAQTILLFYVSNTLSGENVTWDELLGKKKQAKF